MRTRRKQEVINGVAHKVCTKCTALKSLDCFYSDVRYLDGKTSACKECRILAALPRHYEWRKENPDKVMNHNKSGRKTKLQNKYGLSMKELDSILMEQSDLCAICRKGISFDSPDKRDVPHVDHNHETGLVRGLLCLTCNTGIGMLGDSIDLLEKAKQYLMTSGQRERLSELAPAKDDATVRSHGNENHEKSAEMTDSIH